MNLLKLCRIVQNDLIRQSSEKTVVLVISVKLCRIVQNDLIRQSSTDFNFSGDCTKIARLSGFQLHLIRVIFVRAKQCRPTLITSVYHLPIQWLQIVAYS